MKLCYIVILHVILARILLYKTQVKTELGYKMNGLIKTLALAIFALSASAEAAFLATDWKSSGDGLATLDTKSGLEWLDLSQSRNKSINEVLSGLEEGGVYAGWRLPTATEVEAMFTNFMGDYPFDDYTRGDIDFSATYGVYDHSNMYNYTSSARSYATTFENLFGRAYYKIADYHFGYQARGVYLDDNGSVKISGMLREHNTWNRNHYQRIWAGADTGWGLNSKTTYTSVWLVSDGGTTLSSILNPEINVGTDPRPSHEQDDISDVSVPIFGLFPAFALLALIRLRRK